MKFDILIENTIKDLNEELKKEKNMNYIKYEILNKPRSTEALFKITESSVLYPE